MQDLLQFMQNRAPNLARHFHSAWMEHAPLASRDYIKTIHDPRRGSEFMIFKGGSAATGITT